VSAASWRFWADAPPNAGKRYPAEVLTPAGVTVAISQCSPRAPTGVRNRAMLKLLYRSGLRVSEMTAARPADLSLNAHTVRVLDSKATTHGFTLPPTTRSRTGTAPGTSSPSAAAPCSAPWPPTRFRGGGSAGVHMTDLTRSSVRRRSAR
jgi:integrase